MRQQKALIEVVRKGSEGAGHLSHKTSEALGAGTPDSVSACLDRRVAVCPRRKYGSWPGRAPQLSTSAKRLPFRGTRLHEWRLRTYDLGRRY